MLAILTMLVRYLLSETNSLICNHDKWFVSEVDELLHFLIVSLNSNFKKGGYLAWGYNSNLSRSNILTWQCWAELNIECKACYKLSNLMHGLLLKTIVSDARSFYFLTQFISSQDFLFFEAISLLKNNCLVFLTIFLKSFQFKNDLEVQYTSSLAVHSLFHQSLDCLVILTYFACSLHIVSTE